VSLGFPIVFIGSIMAFSRVVWFVVGHNLRILKNIEVRKMLFYEIFFFSGLMMIASQLENAYLIGLIFAVIMGYFHGRNPIIGEHFLNNFVINKRFKATMLSIKMQIEKLFHTITVFALGRVE